MRILASLALLAALSPGQSLTGVVASAGGGPVPGVQITLDNSGGTQTTNALGAFTFPTLQNRTYLVTVVPAAGTFAPRQISFRVQGASNMGTVVVQPGALVSGQVLAPSGLPLPGANLDARDVAGVTLFTPNDGTDVNGNFAVTVPVGPTTLRLLPPAGQILVPLEAEAVIAGPLHFGILQMEQAYNVTGFTVDSISSLPITGVRVRTFDNKTDAEVLQLNPASVALGAFTVQLPIGVHRFEFDPPTGNAHAARNKYSVLVLGPTALGPIGLKPSVTISGTVTGPSGPVANCDIDFETVDGDKLFTLHDNTTATGTFAINVPAGTYRMRVDPPPISGLYGTRTAPQTFLVSGTAAPIALQAGVLLQLGILGPAGVEAGADLDFFDPATQTPFILTGDKSDANGILQAIVPTGLFDVALDAAQGSTAAPLRLQAALGGPYATLVFLDQKKVVLDLQPTYGTQSIGQGGSLLVDLRVRNLTTITQPMFLEVALRFPSGSEQHFGTLPMDLFGGFDFSLGELAVPMPPVATGELGKHLRLYLRARDANQLLLDQAYVEFVVE